MTKLPGDAGGTPGGLSTENPRQGLPRPNGHPPGRAEVVVDLQQGIRDAFGVPSMGPLLQNSPRGPHVPVVLVKLITRQRKIAFAREIDLHRGSGPVRDFVDPSVLPVRIVGIRLVTFTRVIPVGQIDGPIRTILELEPAKPRVVDVQEIFLMPGDIP